MPKRKPKALKRISTGLPLLDKLLGGGLVLGSTTLLHSDLGAGKTTLLLQTVMHDGSALYASGEMRTDALHLYCERLSVSVAPDTLIGVDEGGGDVKKMCAFAEKLKVQKVVVDSLPTAWLDDVRGDAGSPQMIKVVANYLTEWALQKKICVVVVGHRNRDGAPPESVLQLVDAVLEMGRYNDNEDPLGIAYDRNGELREGMRNLRVIGCIKSRYCESDVEELFVLDADKGFAPYVSKLAKLP